MLTSNLHYFSEWDFIAQLTGKSNNSSGGLAHHRVTTPVFAVG